MKYDALVVGASVCGAAFAKEARSLGLSTLLIEEDDFPGKGGKCTGLVSKTGLDSTGFDYRKAVVNRIRGADFIGGKEFFSVKSSETKAFVLDRQVFDEQCIKEALKKGAELRLGERAKRIRRIMNGIEVSTFGSKKYSGSYLIGADGVSSFVAKELGFPSINKCVLCYEAELSGLCVGESNVVKIFLNPLEFKGFFGWFVPCSSEIARIGFGTCEFSELNRVKKYFFDYLRSRNFIGDKFVNRREFHALIPLEVRKVTEKGNVFLVGDAAGQTKATTGGGIVFGTRCARIAANCIAEGIDYEKRWRNEIGFTLGLHGFLRRFFDCLSFSSIEFCLFFSRAIGFNEVLEKFGDMDYLFKSNFL